MKPLASDKEKNQAANAGNDLRDLIIRLAVNFILGCTSWTCQVLTLSYDVTHRCWTPDSWCDSSKTPKVGKRHFYWIKPTVKVNLGRPVCPFWPFIFEFYRPPKLRPWNRSVWYSIIWTMQFYDKTCTIEPFTLARHTFHCQWWNKLKWRQRYRASIGTWFYLICHSVKCILFF